MAWMVVAAGFKDSIIGNAVVMSTQTSTELQTHASVASTMALILPGFAGG